MRAEPGRLIFIDETSVKTNMCRLRGRSPRGERLKGQAPFGRWSTQTFIAGLKCDGLIAPFLVDGPMDGEAFDVYIETQLSPLLHKRDVVICDNLNVHKSPRAAASSSRCSVRLCSIKSSSVPQSNRRCGSRWLSFAQSITASGSVLVRSSSISDSSTKPCICATFVMLLCALMPANFFGFSKPSRSAP